MRLLKKTMAKTVYIRTHDGVLVRFDDPAVLKSWLEAGKITFADLYRNEDLKWVPVSGLFEIKSEALGTEDKQTESEEQDAPVVQKPPLPVQTPTVPMVMKPLEEPEPEPEQQVQVPTDDRPRLEVEVVQAPPEPEEEPAKAAFHEYVSPKVDDPGPKRVASEAEGQRVWAVDDDVESDELELWGSEADAMWLAEQRRTRRRLLIGALTCVAIAVLGALGWYWLTEQKNVAAPPATEKTTLPAVSRKTPPPLPPVPKPEVEARPVVVEDAVSASDAKEQARETPVPETLVIPSVEVKKPAEREPPAAVESLQPPVKKVKPAAAPASREEPVDPVSASSDDCDKHMSQGNRLIRKSPKKAYTHFQFAARVCPGLAEPRAKMGDCEFRSGKMKQAAVHFQAALKVGPNYGPAIIGLARTHSRLGNDTDARYHYMRYLKVNPYGSQAQEAKDYLGP